VDQLIAKGVVEESGRFGARSQWRSEKAQAGGPARENASAQPRPSSVPWDPTRYLRNQPRCVALGVFGEDRWKVRMQTPGLRQSVATSASKDCGQNQTKQILGRPDECARNR